MKEGIKILENVENGQNFPVKVGDEIFWISRAMAVVGFVFKIMHDNRLYILTETRGKGAADNVGKLCVPCGYLDFNETLEEAVLRELKEETGFIGKKEKLTMLKINSNPKENRQNVSAHFAYFADESENFAIEKAAGGEKDEIETVTWLCVGKIKKLHWFKRLFKKDKRDFLYDLTNLKDFNWAFNHDKRIYEHVAKFYKVE